MTVTAPSTRDARIRIPSLGIPIEMMQPCMKVIV